jgi:hypothetical protein
MKYRQCNNIDWHFMSLASHQSVAKQCKSLSESTWNQTFLLVKALPVMVPACRCRIAVSSLWDCIKGIASFGCAQFDRDRLTSSGSTCAVNLTYYKPVKRLALFRQRFVSQAVLRNPRTWHCASSTGHTLTHI